MAADGPLQHSAADFELLIGLTQLLMMLLQLCGQSNQSLRLQKLRQYLLINPFTLITNGFSVRCKGQNNTDSSTMLMQSACQKISQ
jgi:hypothetical protein